MSELSQVFGFHDWGDRGSLTADDQEEYLGGQARVRTPGHSMTGHGKSSSRAWIVQSIDMLPEQLPDFHALLQSVSGEDVGVVFAS